MKAALVTGPNQTPVYDDFAEPTPQAGYQVVTVTASALSNVARSLAASSHYGSPNVFPMVVGIDGVGYTERGQRVYFVLPQPPFGGMAEQTLVLTDHCVPLPEDVEDRIAAAIANPAMSSVAALRGRAAFNAGETVLVNGATGAAGKLAVQLTKYLGAKKVIATGRDAAALHQAEQLGADVTVNLSLAQGDVEAAFGEQFRGEGVDIVLDYLFGQSAETLLTAAARASNGAKPIRYVAIGSASGQEITLPSAVLRAAPIAIMGSGLGSVPWTELKEAVREALQAVVPGNLYIEAKTVPLADVEKAWNEDTGRARVVFVMS